MKTSLKTTLLVFILLFSFSTVALADQYLTLPSWKWAIPGTVYYKFSNLTSNTSWSSYVSSGVSAWNNAGTKVKMYSASTISSNGVKIYAGDYGNTGWDGSTSKDLIMGIGEVLLNNSYTSAKNNGAELTAHELGHTHGLRDVPYNVLMIDSGYIGSANPTVHDKEGITALYGN